MIKTLLCSLVLMLANFKAITQETDNIRTGRPGYSIGSGVVGHNYLQHQMGINLISQKNSPNKTYSNDHVFRFGISDYFEVGMNTGFNLTPSLTNDKLTSERIGLTFRTRITKEKKYLPAMCIQVGSKLPLSKDNVYLPSVILSATKGLSDNFSLTSNLVFQSGLADNSSIGLTLNGGYSLSNTTSILIESYIQNFKDMEQTIIATGIGHLLNNDVQLDLYGGYELNNDQKLFLSAGISWRINTKQ